MDGLPMGKTTYGNSINRNTLRSHEVAVTFKLSLRAEWVYACIKVRGRLIRQREYRRSSTPEGQHIWVYCTVYYCTSELLNMV